MIHRFSNFYPKSVTHFLRYMGGWFCTIFLIIEKQGEKAKGAHLETENTLQVANDTGDRSPHTHKEFCKKCGIRMWCISANELPAQECVGQGTIRTATTCTRTLGDCVHARRGSHRSASFNFHRDTELKAMCSSIHEAEAFPRVEVWPLKRESEFNDCYCYLGFSVPVRKMLGPCRRVIPVDKKRALSTDSSLPVVFSTREELEHTIYEGLAEG
ncbi:hypothetical protein EI94DRAFT_1704150 [Lactarius quietus]|nr:hypothetical protein EI94DRAFT_1704150 [Lactarius quietus]